MQAITSIATVLYPLSAINSTLSSRSFSLSFSYVLLFTLYTINIRQQTFFKVECLNYFCFLLVIDIKITIHITNLNKTNLFMEKIP